MHQTHVLSELQEKAQKLGKVPGWATDIRGQKLDTSNYEHLYPAAQAYTYHWFDRSPLKQDKAPRESAIETSLLAVVHQGNAIGGLRLSYTTPQMMKEAFVRPLQFADENLGWSLGYWKNKFPSEQELWLDVPRYARKAPASLEASNVRYWSLDKEHLPDAQTIKSDLVAFEVDLRKKMAAFARTYRKPFVAYSSIEKELIVGNMPRRGIGTVMYLLAADHMSANHGMGFRASGVQSAAAKGLWASFERDWPEKLRYTYCTHWLNGKRSRHRELF